jgi:CheY-like chemotaxis protein
MNNSILIIDTEVDVSTMLQGYFNLQGYDISIAHTGGAALENIHRQPPSLILMDIVLPDMDGFELCKILRANPRTSKTPIVILTKKAERNDSLQGFKHGADDYIIKPFDISELRLRVKRLILKGEKDNLYDPVTGLPTIRIMEDFFLRVLKQKQWAFLNIGIESFDDFEETHGFIAANRLLCLTREVIDEALTELRNYEAHAGHIDDSIFAVIVEEQFASIAAVRLKAGFAERMSAFYESINASQDRDQLSIRSQIKLVIGCVLSTAQQAENFREVVELSTQLRKKDQADLQSTSARLVEEQIRHIQHNSGWALLDVFINHFEVYREVYTIAESSSIAPMTQELIAEISGEMEIEYTCFVDPDDENHFWIILPSAHAQTICDKFKSRFSETAYSKYYDAHKKKRFVRSKDGDEVPFMNLSVGICIPVDETDPKVILKMAEEARQLDV